MMITFYSNYNVYNSQLKNLKSYHKNVSKWNKKLNKILYNYN